MQSIAMTGLMVAVGGALGALARYALNLYLQGQGGFPWGTLSANLLGCLVMGVIAQLITSSHWVNESGMFPDHYRLLFAVGFCGSFTTLSALVFELSGMLQRDEILAAFSYLMVSMIGGFACFYLGLKAMRGLLALLLQGST
jgi:CrcB protein